MKTRLRSYGKTVLLVLLLVNCAKNDNFALPDLDCNNPSLPPNTTLQDVDQRADETIHLYPGAAEDVLTAVVISSDEGGNFYNTLCVVDELTQMPAVIHLDLPASFTAYPPGTKILVQLENLSITKSYGQLHLGSGTYTSSSNKQYIGTLPKNAIAQHIKKYCAPIADFERFNHHITLEELQQNTANYLGKLVTVEGVQFDAKLWGKKLYDAKAVDQQGYTLRKVTDAQGHTCYIRTGKRSKDFTTYQIPPHSGPITGIVDVYSQQIQLYPRLLSDIQLDQPPVTDGTQPDPGTDSIPSPDDIVVTPGPILVAPGTDFEQWDDFIAALNKTGVKFATQAPTEGWDTSTGLAFRGSPTKTDLAFTLVNLPIPTAATGISFLLKGTASRRSLTFNLYNAEGHFVAYNLENIQQSQVINPTATTNQTGNVNQYNGQINTQGKWIKIVLPFGDFDYNQTGEGPFLSLRFGGKTATIPSDYDLILDEIRFEVLTETELTFPHP